jgi:hypothetical protein
VSTRLRPPHLSIVIAFTTGCSFIFMDRPREPVAVPNYPIECTSSRVAPALDVVGTTYFVVNSIVILSRPDCGSAGLGESCIDGGVKAGATLLSTALAATFVASAVSGFKSAARCEKVKDLNAQCITGSAAACRQLNPSWVPRPAGNELPPLAPPPAPQGCFKDTDCKGDRICVGSVCVSPAAREKAAPPPPPKAPDSCETNMGCDQGICFDGRCRR